MNPKHVASLFSFTLSLSLKRVCSPVPLSLTVTLSLFQSRRESWVQSLAFLRPGKWFRKSGGHRRFDGVVVVVVGWLVGITFSVQVQTFGWLIFVHFVSTDEMKQSLVVCSYFLVVVCSPSGHSCGWYRNDLGLGTWFLFCIFGSTVL